MTTPFESDIIELFLRELPRWLTEQPELRARLNVILSGEMPSTPFTNDITRQALPPQVAALAAKAENETEKGHYPEALALYNEAISLVPTNAWLLVMRGNVFLQIGSPVEARREFEHAIEIDPDYAMAFSLLGMVLIFQKEFDLAETALRRARWLDPTNANVQVLLDGLEAQRNESAPQEAALSTSEETLQKILAAPDIVLYLQKHEDELNEDLLDVVKKYIEQAFKNGQDELAAGLQNLSGYIQNVIEMRTVPAIDPYQAQLQGETAALVKVALERLERGDLTAAMEHIDHALMEEPDNPWLITQRGNIYYRQEMYEAARREYKKASVLHPKYAHAFTLLGTALSKLRRYVEARAAFEHALDLDSSDPVAKAMLIELQNSAEILSPDAQAESTLRNILASEDVISAVVKTPDAELTPDVQILIRRNAASARANGENELAEGLEGLAVYIEDELASRAHQPVAGWVEKAWSMLIDSEDFPDILKDHEDWIDTSIQMAVKEAATAARSAQNLVKAERLEKLLIYIQDVLSRQ